MSNMPLRGRIHRGETGQGLLEFALVIPLLMLMVVGLFDLGYAVFVNNMISNAAREGARVGIIQMNTNADICNRVIAAAPGLNLSCQPGSIDIDPSPTRDYGEPITVTVTFTYTPMTPLMGQFVGGGLRLSSSSVMVTEGVLQFQP